MILVVEPLTSGGSDVRLFPVAKSLVVDDGCLVPTKTAVRVDEYVILSCWPKIEFTRTYLKILMIALPKSNPRLNVYDV